MDSKRQPDSSAHRKCEDALLDSDEAAGVFFEAWCNCGTETEEPEEVSVPRLRGNRTEQQLLFHQLFSLFTEPFVDPLLGLFHCRKRKQDLIH